MELWGLGTCQGALGLWGLSGDVCCCEVLRAVEISGSGSALLQAISDEALPPARSDAAL